MESICPKCHVIVRATDFFCYNCGKNLHPKPLSTSLITQAMYYAGALILPPMGIIWGIRYLRQAENKAKVVGLILIALNVIELILVTQWTIQLINTLNMQVSGQLNSIQGF